MIRQSNILGGSSRFNARVFHINYGIFWDCKSNTLLSEGWWSLEHGLSFLDGWMKLRDRGMVRHNIAKSTAPLLLKVICERDGELCMKIATLDGGGVEWFKKGSRDREHVIL